MLRFEMNRLSVSCVFGSALLAMASGCSMNSARVFLSSGDPLDPRSECRGIDVPASSDNNSQMGVNYLKIGDYREARACFERAVAEDPEDHRSHFGLGVSCEATGDLGAAVTHYEKALRLAPGNGEYLGQLQQARAKAGGLTGNVQLSSVTEKPKL